MNQHTIDPIFCFVFMVAIIALAIFIGGVVVICTKDPIKRWWKNTFIHKSNGV